MRLNINTSLANGRSNGRKSPDEAKRPVKFLLDNQIYLCSRTVLSKYPESHLAKLVGATSTKSTTTPPLVDLWEIHGRSGKLFELVIKLMEQYQDTKKTQSGSSNCPVVDLSEPKLRDDLLRELTYYNLPCLTKLVQ